MSAEWITDPNDMQYVNVEVSGEFIYIGGSRGLLKDPVAGLGPAGAPSRGP